MCLPHLHAVDPPGDDAPPSVGDLGLEDLASILDARGEDATPAHGRLARILRREPRLSGKVAELEALAEDAGVPGCLWSGLMLNRRFDRLLAAADWRDPAEVLELEDWEDVFYPELIRIAAVRAARNGGGGRELEVLERLLAAEARGMEEALRGFVRPFSQLSPEGARRALELVPQLCEAEHPA
jgi:hypothetical protein